jgi:ACS family tartrate transporter-like MFS transporter
MKATTLDAAVNKALWRLLPITMLLFFFSLLDRTNISFAALEMNKDLGLSPPQYGTAAGIFFVGYFLFEIPSNFLLQRTGARAWLARIMITWGLVVVAMAWVQGLASLYVLRFLLGVAEAGLLPGLLLYLSLWLPAQQRGLAFATLLATPAIAYVIGAPLTAVTMKFSAFGLHGWQFMYLVQGAATVLVGIATFFILPNTIEHAGWLAADEKTSLRVKLKAEYEEKKLAGATDIWQGFFDPRVLLATATGFFLVCANFGTVLWLPQIVKAILPQLGVVQISLLISLAFLIGGVGGILWGRHSDKTGDRKWHVVGSALLAAFGYTLAGWSGAPVVQFVGLCIGILGIWSIFGVFWAYVGDLLGGEAATGGLAFVNSIGTVGGLVAPIVLAFALQKYGSIGGSLYALAVFSLLTALLACTLKPIGLKMQRSTAVGLAG